MSQPIDPATTRADLLAAVRRVNRLIVSEQDPDVLAARACELLTKNLSFHNAWLMLEGEAPARFVGSQVPGGRAALEAAVETARMTCLERVRAGAGITIVEDPPQDCSTCPFANAYQGRKGFAGQIRRGERAFGVLVVSVPAALAHDPDIREVFEELLDDLGFAFDRIEERRRAELEQAVSLELLSGLRGASDPSEVLPEVERLIGRALGGAMAQARVGAAREEEVRQGQWSLPLTHLGDSVGVLEITQIPKGRLDERSKSFVRGLAAHVAAAVAQADTTLKLSASEAWLRGVLAVAPVGISVTRARTIIDVNEACCELTGYPREELVGAPTRALYLDDEAYDEVTETVERQLEVGSTASFEATWRRRDGRAIRVSVQVTRLDPDDPDSGFASTIADITVRERQARVQQARLRSSELAAAGTSRAALVSAVLEDIARITGSPGALFAHVGKEGELEPYGEHGGLGTTKSMPVVWREPGSVLFTARRTGRAGSTSAPNRAAAPVLRGGQVVAVVCVWDKVAPYDPAEVGVLEELGTMLWEAWQRLSAEEALLESEERYRMLFDNMAAGVALYEPREDGDFTVVNLNEAACRISHVRLEDVVGQPVTRAFPGVREMGLFAILEQVAKSGKTLRLPSTVYRDGRIQLAVENTVFSLPSGHVVALFEDSSEVRRAEAERDRLIRAIEQAGEMVMISDAAGIFEYVNPAFEKVTGFSRSEVIGRPARILRTSEQTSEFYDEMWQVLQRGDTWTGRMVSQARDGSTYTEEAVISPVRDTRGEIVNYVCVSRDVTQELALEHQLRQAQKMEAIGQLTGGVAHDFNNLLQVINGAADLARMDLDEAHPARASVDDISHAGTRAAGLVQQLLVFSRRQVLRPSGLALDAVVEELLRMLVRLLGERVELIWRPGGRAAHIHADRGMVEQAIVNLCVNARQAMPEGGTLTLATQTVVLARDDLSGTPWASAGRFVTLSVEDTGVGMDESTVEHAFEPFFTTKPPGEGTGLGLATVYGIMKQHEGLVRVDTAPERGSRFELLWPSRAPAAAAGQAGGAKASPGAGTILLAEDEAGVREITTRMLERSGYSVIVAKDGVEAVRKFTDNQPRIDLVVLDAIMPRMTGFEAYERIHGLDPDMPVLFASGYSEDALQGGGLDRAKVPILAKPFDRAALTAAVEAALLGTGDYPSG